MKLTKLILIAAIVIIIFYAISQIEVVHIDTFDDEEKKEVEERNKARTILLNNYIKCTNTNKKQSAPIEKFTNLSSSKKSSTKSSTKDLIKKIATKFVDRNYLFNAADQPVCREYFDQYCDKMYVTYIKHHINKWNRILPDKLEIDGIRCQYVDMAMNEFVLVANVKLRYNYLPLYLSLRFYGITEFDDEIVGGDNAGSNKLFQLIGIKRINRDGYSAQPVSNSPFITMQQQMNYVRQVERMHRDEAD